MEKYSINDLVEMTGLTDRTLRNYIKSGLLRGEKIDGVWQFTAEDYGAFISDKNVIPSLRAKKNGVVYDFLLNDKKKEAEACSILDFPADLAEAMAISAYFCDAVNKSDKKLKMNFEHRGNNARVIISGDAAGVWKIISGFYSK
ncbi:MAG: MerR family transcriptional regulator [Ruminococcaceae bacterium]|nr:MerR family transcriptional regulator [Oscillospiraceae bacterium]